MKDRPAYRLATLLAFLASSACLFVVSQPAFGAEVFQDPETRVTIRRLTRGPHHHKHSYYTLSPWSPDGRRIVFSSAAPGSEIGKVGLMDTDGGNVRVLTDKALFNSHSGAYPMWHPDGRQIIFRPSGNDTAAYAFLNVDSRQVRFLTARHFRLSPDGRRIAYFEGPDLAVMNTDGGGRRVIARQDVVSALSPLQQEIRASPVRLKAPRWSPDGKELMVALTNEGNDSDGKRKPLTVKELYIVRADGSLIRRVVAFRHHAVWSPSGRHVLFVDKDGICLIDKDGANRRVVCELAQGHPTFNPQETLIVTDVFNGELKDSLALIDPNSGEYRKLLNCPRTVGPGRGRVTHPHPVWSSDGRQILYDSDQTGTCQIYVADVPAWSELPRRRD